MESLSANARIVLGSVFGWNATLTYQMLESVPSPEMQQALDELVSSGMLLREKGLDDMPSHGRAVRYRVADGIDLTPFRSEATQSILDGKAPSIRVFIKRDAQSSEIVTKG